MSLHFMKTDAVKGHQVPIAGAKFKVWNCQTKDWVKQTIVYPSFVEIDVFETNEKGELYTPEKLYAGEYIVYEVEAPAGYMLNPDWAIPENESDIGKKDKTDVETFSCQRFVILSSVRTQSSGPCHPPFITKALRL